MALISCSECGSEMSDKAAACPKCGAPIKVAKPKRKSSLGTLLIIGGVVVVAVMTIVGGGGSGPSSTGIQARKAWAPSAEDKAKQPERAKLIDKLGAQGLWSKWEPCQTIDVCVYVRGPFYGLEIEKKQDFIRLMWTYHAVKEGSEGLAVHVKDALSGKEVGVYERNKLTMN